MSEAISGRSNVVIRVSATWVVEFFRTLDQLINVRPGLSGPQVWLPHHRAKEKLEQLFLGSLYSEYLNASRVKIDNLMDELNEIIEESRSDPNREFSEFDLFSVQSTAREMKTILAAEFETFPIYLISQKENYNIDRLIGNGLGLFPPTLRWKVPESVNDATEASKCLAFERNTACGFHTFRVVEAVLRRYWDVVTEGQDRPHPEALGKMAADLKSKGKGEARVCEALLQLAKLHRNPLAHPDVNLSSDEAISILGMSRSVATLMLDALPDVILPECVDESIGD